MMWYINFVSTPSFLTLRSIWSGMSVVFLVKKIYDFYHFGRLLYLIDFCYYANFCFAYAIWNVPIDSGGYMSRFPEYAKALYWKKFPDYAKVRANDRECAVYARATVSHKRPPRRSS